MSVLDQSFVVKEASCFDCNLYPSSPKHRQSDLAVMSNEDMLRKQEIDALLSEGMNALSFAEREEQQEVLHGVEKAIAEEDDFIETALKDLEEHLTRMKHGTVYEIAERMDSTYVHARAFRVTFLRGKRYDAKASAKQMLSFFEVKQQLFGNANLAKDITIDDLDENDREALKVGSIQLAGKDTSNRQVVLQLPGLKNFRNIQSELRATYYIIMDAVRSEQTQLKGIVVILYTIGHFKDRSNGAGVFKHNKLALSMPLHNAAIHCCFDNPNQYILIKAGLAAVNAKLRARIKVHFGSHLECQYQLSTYGISRQNLPLMHATNNIDMRYHLAWYHTHTMKSKSDIRKPKNDPHAAASKKSVLVTQPTVNDVLYMGGNKMNSAGNDHLRDLVAEWSETYDSGTNEAKRRVVNEIIDEIHRSEGRFLSQVNGAESVWETVSIEDVRSKITQMFRNRRRKVRVGKIKKAK
ncbi:unnamed protein product [Cylindrotheca closterium]|uniref:DUF6824 domain-containing protein n=1 Tax=Cylindrotheca closterium TaxID=2856 RepID=A0AAD2FEI5_9STRA|nr:unnamed protein product [Cylindrotheca closterium]